MLSILELAYVTKIHGVYSSLFLTPCEDASLQSSFLEKKPKAVYRMNSVNN